MRVVFAVFVSLACINAWAASSYSVQDGDIVFHTSRSTQSLSIQKATHSPYSHMGIVFLRNGEPFVFEAVATVRYTPLDAWVKRGEGGKFVVRRLKSPLTSSQVQRLRDAAPTFASKPYDLTFEWSDTRIYCSELVWKLYDRALGIQIGTLQKLREFDLTDPTVRKMMKQRYGDAVPLDSTVISPAAMFDSPLLKQVEAKGS